MTEETLYLRAVNACKAQQTTYTTPYSPNDCKALLIGQEVAVQEYAKPANDRMEFAAQQQRYFSRIKDEAQVDPAKDLVKDLASIERDVRRNIVPWQDETEEDKMNAQEQGKQSSGVRKQGKPYLCPEILHPYVVDAVRYLRSSNPLTKVSTEDVATQLSTAYALPLKKFIVLAMLSSKCEEVLQSASAGVRLSENVPAAEEGRLSENVPSSEEGSLSENVPDPSLALALGRTAPQMDPISAPIPDPNRALAPQPADPGLHSITPGADPSTAVPLMNAGLQVGLQALTAANQHDGLSVPFVYAPTTNNVTHTGDNDNVSNNNKESAMSADLLQELKRINNGNYHIPQEILYQLNRIENSRKPDIVEKLKDVDIGELSNVLTLLRQIHDETRNLPQIAEHTRSLYFHPVLEALPSRESLKPVENLTPRPTTPTTQSYLTEYVRALTVTWETRDTPSFIEKNLQIFLFMALVYLEQPYVAGLLSLQENSRFDSIFATTNTDGASADEGRTQIVLGCLYKFCKYLFCGQRISFAEELKGFSQLVISPNKLNSVSWVRLVDYLQNSMGMYRRIISVDHHGSILLYSNSSDGCFEHIEGYLRLVWVNQATVFLPTILGQNEVITIMWKDDIADDNVKLICESILSKAIQAATRRDNNHFPCLDCTKKMLVQTDDIAPVQPLCLSGDFIAKLSLHYGFQLHFKCAIFDADQQQALFGSAGVVILDSCKLEGNGQPFITGLDSPGQCPRWKMFYAHQIYTRILQHIIIEGKNPFGMVQIEYLAENNNLLVTFRRGAIEAFVQSRAAHGFAAAFVNETIGSTDHKEGLRALPALQALTFDVTHDDEGLFDLLGTAYLHRLQSHGIHFSTIAERLGTECELPCDFLGMDVQDVIQALDRNVQKLLKKRFGEDMEDPQMARHTGLC